MGDTWGIPGATFLELYLVLLALATVGTFLLVHSLDRPRVDDGDVTIPGADDLALVVGGRARLVQAAIARMLEGDTLRISREYRLGPTTAGPDDDLDAAVLDEVRPSPRSVHTVVRRVRHSTAAHHREAGAVERGLLHAPQLVRRRHLAGAALFLAVFALGAIRFAVGLHRGAPVAFLFMLLVATGFFVVTAACRPAHRPTPRGRAIVRRAGTEQERLRREWSDESDEGTPSTVAGWGAAALVAVGGFAFYPDFEVSHLLAASGGIYAGGGFGAGATGLGGGGGGGGGAGGGGGGGGCGG